MASIGQDNIKISTTTDHSSTTESTVRKSSLDCNYCGTMFKNFEQLENYLRNSSAQNSCRSCATAQSFLVYMKQQTAMQPHYGQSGLFWESEVEHSNGYSGYRINRAIHSSLTDDANIENENGSSGKDGMSRYAKDPKPKLTNAVERKPKSLKKLSLQNKANSTLNKSMAGPRTRAKTRQMEMSSTTDNEAKAKNRKLKKKRTKLAET